MIDLSGRSAIITGAAGGLGRTHALLLAARGARVLVNDAGDGAQVVVDEILANGGQAMAMRGSVTDEHFVADMVQHVADQWGSVDILVNNAGILRDRTFAKMSLADFRDVVDVHLMGAVICTQAVWPLMQAANYGRIVFTTSSSGLFGNFGQCNYGAAKLALVGLMQTLALEGVRNNIRVNCLAPSAATRMTDSILPAEQLAMLEPGKVSPGVLALVSDHAPNRVVLCGGAGSFELAHVTLTKGVYLGDGESIAENLLQQWNEVEDRSGSFIPEQGFEQFNHELAKAGFKQG